MKSLLEVLFDLFALRSPLKSSSLVDFAVRLAQWVFLLILSLTVTGVLLFFAGR
jgi:hypothetical protein